jgi:hypothetical protein
MNALIHWLSPTIYPELWKFSRCLYAYTYGEEILYIGKSVGTTVRGRWVRSGKSGFWDALEEDRGIFEHIVLVGIIELPKGRRLSRETIADIESLLICRVKPWGNIQCRNSRITRPGLTVLCEGGWPLEHRLFIDE